MYNWKKEILRLYMEDLNEFNSKFEIVNDRVNKKYIDDFMNNFQEYDGLNYLQKQFKTNKYLSYKDIKMFLYCTFLDKYTGTVMFNNSDESKLWDL